MAVKMLNKSYLKKKPSDLQLFEFIIFKIAASTLLFILNNFKRQ